MRRILLAAAGAAALALPALAFARPPDDAAQMADTWLYQSHGQTLCRLRLSDRAGADGVYGVRAPGDCGQLMPAGVAGWKPTDRGVALVGADGATLVPFTRWSESLYVASGPGAPDVQLSRAPAGQAE